MFCHGLLHVANGEAVCTADGDENIISLRGGGLKENTQNTANLSNQLHQEEFYEYLVILL